jgi:hypothetical protein
VLGQVEQAGELGDPGAGTDLPLGVVRRCPRTVGDQVEQVGRVACRALTSAAPLGKTNR